LSKYLVQPENVDVLFVEIPFEIIRNIYTPLSDALSKSIIDFRKYGDEQQAIDSFDLLMDITRALRYWESNSRSPF
jgi:hypothetical protein